MSMRTVSRVAFGVMILWLAWMVAGCAGKKMNTAISLAPVIAGEIRAVQVAVEGQKDGLKLADCSSDPTRPRNCYLVFQDVLLQVATWDKALNDSLAAMNTTSAKEAIGKMSGLVSQWIQQQLIKLPDSVRLYILIALESLRGGLLAAGSSLGG